MLGLLANKWVIIAVAFALLAGYAYVERRSAQSAREQAAIWKASYNAEVAAKEALEDDMAAKDAAMAALRVERNRIDAQNTALLNEVANAQGDECTDSPIPSDIDGVFRRAFTIGGGEDQASHGLNDGLPGAAVSGRDAD